MIEATSIHDFSEFATRKNDLVKRPKAGDTQGEEGHMIQVKCAPDSDTAKTQSEEDTGSRQSSRTKGDCGGTSAISHSTRTVITYHI